MTKTKKVKSVLSGDRKEFDNKVNRLLDKDWSIHSLGYENDKFVAIMEQTIDYNETKKKHDDFLKIEVVKPPEEFDKIEGGVNTPRSDFWLELSKRFNLNLIDTELDELVDVVTDYVFQDRTATADFLVKKSFEKSEVGFLEYLDDIMRGEYYLSNFKCPAPPQQPDNTIRRFGVDYHEIKQMKVLKTVSDTKNSVMVNQGEVLAVEKFNLTKQTVKFNNIGGEFHLEFFEPVYSN